jgi:hypothetical protein
LGAGADVFKIGQRLIEIGGDQVFGRDVGQRAEQDGIDDGEDGGVSANAESESQDGDGGEAGIFAERAEGETKILSSDLEKRESAAGAVGFLGGFDAAKFQEGLAAGFGGRQAGAEVVVDMELEVGFDFIGEVAVVCGWVERAAELQKPFVKQIHFCSS